jgi:hypothetical protein
MTSQSINNIQELLQLLTKDSKGYYIEQKSISSKEEIDGHTIYSKFKYYNKEITQTLLKQHLSKEINIALSLKNYSAVAYDYSGNNKEAFASLISYFYKQEGFNDIFITTLDNNKLTLYISLNLDNKEQFTKLINKIEKNLQDRLPKEWRVLPNFLRPDIGNLLQLPREFLRYE